MKWLLFKFVLNVLNQLKVSRKPFGYHFVIEAQLVANNRHSFESLIDCQWVASKSTFSSFGSHHTSLFVCFDLWLMNN